MQDMDKLHELGDEELEAAIGGLDLEAILLALEQRQEEGSLSGKMLSGIRQALFDSGQADALEKLAKNTEGGLPQLGKILSFFK